MQRLTELVAAGKAPRVALVGAGGKTSLLWALASRHRAQKTLVLATTKTRAPEDPAMYDRYLGSAELERAQAATGITLAGETDALNKMGFSDLALLGRAAQRYDVVLMEADGSRMLPLKAWADYEPVVPPFVTETVGILPLWPLGLPADGSLIHRPGLFYPLTGARQGQALEPEHFVRLITGNAGLFARAVGEKRLLFNQIETDEDLARAKSLADRLPLDFKRTLKQIIAGSVHKDKGVVLWETK